MWILSEVRNYLKHLFFILSWLENVAVTLLCVVLGKDVILSPDRHLDIMLAGALVMKVARVCSGGERDEVKLETLWVRVCRAANMKQGVAERVHACSARLREVKTVSKLSFTAASFHFQYRQVVQSQDLSSRHVAMVDVLPRQF